MIHKVHTLIEQSQWDKRCKRLRPRDTIDSIHEIDDIRRTYANYECKNHHPPHVQMQDVQLIKHHQHSSELRHKPHAVRQRMNVVNETHASNQRHCQQEPNVVPDFQIQRRYSPCRSKSQPNPQRQKENNPTATQDNAGVRRTLIRFVNDIESVCHLEIGQFQDKKNQKDDSVNKK